MAPTSTVALALARAAALIVLTAAAACGDAASTTAGAADAGGDIVTSDVAGPADAGVDVSGGTSSCSWASDGPACQPLSPRALFDIAAIQAMTLDDLEWAVEGSDTYQGVQVVKGAFSGGSWAAYTREGQPTTITLDYVAAVYLPDGWPKPGDPRAAYVSAVHFEANLLQPIAAQIASYFRVPVVHVGHRDNWHELGFDSRKTLHGASTSQVIAHNPCEPVDIARGHFPVAMAQADMRAITLAQRLAEQAGGQVDEVAFRGFSKEGQAGWLLIAVDPRVTVAAVGGYHNQDALASAEVRADSWGCHGNPVEPDYDPSGPQRAGIVPDWYRHTAAGAAYLNAFDVQHNKDLLYPRFLLLDGDVGMRDMHDDLYAFGAETPFLDGLTEVPWRYVRKATHTNGATDEDGDEVSKAVVPGLLVENLVGGAGSEDTVYPKVLTASATIEADQLVVEATATAPAQSMVLWWSWSDDGTWNDAGQVGWTEVHMTDDAGTWRAPAVDVPPGKVVGWYVEARNTALVGQTERTRADAAPVRFLRPPAGTTCAPELPEWCDDPDFTGLLGG